MSVMYWYVFDSMLPPRDGGSFEALPIHRATMTARATHTAMLQARGEISPVIVSSVAFSICCNQSHSIIFIFHLMYPRRWSSCADRSE